ncbi:MAG: DUF2786 domain-containing protein, partial [Desulfobacteraceae bacterium]
MSREILWAGQLLKEFEQVCISHGLNLRRPAFNISESAIQYGSWDPVTRRLSISRHLIENHPWHIVVEVLKHEMAHQYVNEVVKARETHGPIFRKACKMIGVHPFFMGAGNVMSSDIPGLTGKISSRAGALIQRIEKLLSLTRSANEHEARLAAEKAQELIQKHNLEQFSPEAERNLTENQDPMDFRAGYRVITHKKKRIESFQKGIAGILIEFYFIDVVTAGIYDAHDHDTYKSLVLFGTWENLEAAEYVYHYLFSTGNRLWKAAKRSHGYGSRERVSFLMGFLQGIRDNLELARMPKGEVNADRGAVIEAMSALTESLRQQNRMEIQRVFPRLSRGRRSMYRLGDAYDQGVKTGKNTTIR